VPVRFFTPTDALCSRFDAVIDRVANHVYQRIVENFNHVAVDLGIRVRSCETGWFFPI